MPNQDYYIDNGYTPEEILAVVEATPELTPTQTVQFARQGLQIKSFADLLKEPVQAIEWAWEGILPLGGLSILTAKPKVGKSTLARNLAVKILHGEPFLGRDTLQGPVIYLALEEHQSQLMMQLRLMGVQEEDPLHIHIGQAPQKALQELEVKIKEIKPVLVIIDPLFKLVHVNDGNDYVRVSAALEPILMLARNVNTHVMLIHHGRKGQSEEGTDAPLGSQALSGGVDSLIEMRKSGDNRYVSTPDLRYGSPLEKTVVFLDPDTFIISEGGTVAEVEQSDAAEEILDAIETSGVPLTETDIQERVKLHRNVINATLRKLRDSGQIICEGAGKRGDPFHYSLPDVGNCNACNETPITQEATIEPEIVHLSFKDDHIDPSPDFDSQPSINTAFIPSDPTSEWVVEEL